MRSKEEAHDYRYFPDPDLLPLTFSAEFVEDIARSLPELPDDKKKRFMEEYSLSAYDAGVLFPGPKMPIFRAGRQGSRCQGDCEYGDRQRFCRPEQGGTGHFGKPGAG